MAFPVLFVHGMWSTGAAWERMAGRFEAQGHPVRAPTLPHHHPDPTAGAPSALGALGLGDYVDFLREEARQLPAPPLLVGHAMGGLLAARLAAEGVGFASVHLGTVPVAGIVGVRPRTLRVARSILSTPNWWRRPVRLRRRAAAWALTHRLPAKDGERVLDGLTYESGRALRQVALWPLDGRATPAAMAPGGLPRPSLFIHGTEDRFAPIGAAKATARRAGPKATFTQLAGRGHWLPSEPGWERLADDVRHWARSFTPEGRRDAPAAAPRAG
ncbi:MAG: alpha/beta hydrolase [Myxococcota bacterium]